MSSGNTVVGMFFYGIGLLGTYAALDLMMTEKFIFYVDKIVKVSKLFGSKEMKYEDSTLGITMVRTNPIFNSLSVYSFFKKVTYSNIHIYNTHISIDRRMISENTENKIMDFVSKLLNQNIREKHKQSKILNFDLKNYIGN